MSRRSREIKVIIHPPEDQKSIEAIQNTTDELYVRIIENKLSKTNLTLKEKEYVVRKVIDGLSI